MFSTNKIGSPHIGFKHGKIDLNEKSGNSIFTLSERNSMHGPELSVAINNKKILRIHRQRRRYKREAKMLTISLVWLMLLQCVCLGANNWRVVIVKSQGDYENNRLPGEGMQYPHSMVRSYSNPEYIYWAHDCGQGWRSRNGGETWERFLAKGLGTLYGQSIEVDPANASTVFMTLDNLWVTVAAVDQGLYKSTDAGDNWELVLPVNYDENNRWYKHNIAYALNSVSGGEAKIWYAAFADQGLYKSIDGGDNWSLVQSLSGHAPIYALYVHPENSDILYLGSNLGLYSSTDGANTLNPLGNLPSGGVTSIQVNYSEPDEIYAVVRDAGLYKSTNGGANFSLLRGPNYAVGCFINQGYPEVIYFLKRINWSVSSSGIEVSQDGGITWNDIVSHPREGLGRESGFGSRFRVDDGLGAIIPNPSSRTEAVGYGQAYLWKTTNCIDFYHANNHFSGYTWTCRDSVLFDPANPNRFAFFGADIGMFISENAGAYFELLATPLSILIDYGYAGNSNDLKAGAFKPGSNSFVASGGQIWGKGRMGIVFSPDNDGPWETTSLDRMSWDYAAGRYGAYRNYFYNPDNPNELFVSDIKSTDGGRTFDSISFLVDNDLEIYGMCKSNPNVLYALNETGTAIYKSTDGGENWAEYVSKSWYAYPTGASPLSEIVFDIDPVNSNIIYTLYQGGDLARFDGNNWQPLGLLPFIRSLPENSQLVNRHTHPGYPGINAVIVDPNNNSVIYAATANPGVSAVYRSTNSGNTWEDISYNLPRAGYGTALSINPHSGEIFVGGGSGTWVFPPPYNQNTLIYTNSVIVNAGDSDPNTHTLSVTAINGSVNKTPNKSSYTSGEEVTLQAVPNAGYSFVNWSGDLSGSSNPVTIVMNSDKSVTANFTINTYTITASTGSGGQISPSGSTQVSSGNSQAYTISANAGYHIADVLVDGSSVGAVSSYTFTNVTANHTIAVSFAVNTYTITASAGSGGQISPSGSTQVSSGSSQAYTISANAGYHIADVLVDGSSVGVVSSYTFTNVTANHTIAVSFAVNTYTITASASSGGQISPSGSTQVSSGGSQVYTISANTGYHIANVLVDGSSVGVVSSYNFTNITANHTIAATFAINTYTITASAGSGGQISPVGTTQVNAGDSQTYTITANAGYHVANVLVDGGSIGAVSSYTFTNVTRNHTISASFDIDETDVTAPTVMNLSPQADYIQSPLNSLITLHITDSGDGVDAGSVTIQINNNLIYSGDTAKYSSAYGECYRTGTEADYTFIYQSNERFNFNQEITVTVNAKDLAGNVMDEYSYSFQTKMRSFGKNKKINKNKEVDGDSVQPDDSIHSGGPTTCSDSEGNIWVAWHSGATGNKDIYVNKLAAGARDFGDSIKLTNSTADQRNPAIAIGSDDKLYVAWQDSRNGNWDIYVSTSTDGVNWSAERRVTDSNDNQINPDIIINRSLPNNAYIAWEDSRNGNQDIYIGASSNGFVTTTASQITSDLSSQVEPAIAVDSDNTVYVVWTDRRNSGNNDIYGAASNSGPWTNIPIVTEDESQSSPVIATESVGSILHLAWVDYRAGENDIYYAKTSGGLPASPLTGSNIIDEPNSDQKRPAIAVDGSTGSNLRIFVCWEDDRNGDNDLYLSEVNSGSGTNVFVGDDGTNTDQTEPAIGIDGYGQPYLVWVDSRNMNADIYYAGSTFVEPDVFASGNVSPSSTITIGTALNAIDSIEDVSVEVPQGAYPCDIMITISKVQNSQEFDFDRFGGPYEFGPSGIDFVIPVTITIPYEVSGTETISYTAYWYNPLTNSLSQQGITDIETVVISSTLHALRFKTSHFTQFLIGGNFGGYSSSSSGGGGGGCSMSPDGQASAAELLLPYLGLIVAMIVLKLRDRRKKKTCNIT
jgi:hypothetical protein